MERGNEGRNVTLVPSSLEDFQKEKIPLYTAAKKEGEIIYGDVDRSIKPEPPEINYSEFFNLKAGPLLDWGYRNLRSRVTSCMRLWRGIRLEISVAEWYNAAWYQAGPKIGNVHEIITSWNAALI